MHMLNFLFQKNSFRIVQYCSGTDLNRNISQTRRSDNCWPAEVEWTLEVASTSATGSSSRALSSIYLFMRILEVGSHKCYRLFKWGTQFHFHFSGSYKCNRLFKQGTEFTFISYTGSKYLDRKSNHCSFKSHASYTDIISSRTLQNISHILSYT